MVEVTETGAPGWLSWLSILLRLRSWSHSLWVWAPCRTLCWQLRGWNQLRILCLLLSLSLSKLCLSLYVSQKINKCKKKIKKKSHWDPEASIQILERDWQWKKWPKKEWRCQRDSQGWPKLVKYSSRKSSKGICQKLELTMLEYSDWWSCEPEEGLSLKLGTKGLHLCKKDRNKLGPYEYSVEAISRNMFEK